MGTRLWWAVIGIASGICIAGEAAAIPIDEPEWSPSHSVLLAQRARTCKDVRSCEEAVELWCSGYRRADGDNDGIPCENVCSSKREVDRIREEIGC